MFDDVIKLAKMAIFMRLFVFLIDLYYNHIRHRIFFSQNLMMLPLI